MSRLANPASSRRNRSTLVQCRAEIEALLTQKWQCELDDRFIKAL
jgi:nuclear transport factor 2 (NTF2) superfamily protein